jgi:phosphoribosyl 1,2-cyclic phosphodiesterase
MRFCSLGSGSGGNATVVESHDGTRACRVVIDCGFSLREFETRLARAGLECSDLNAVFVTHEHGDHVGCALTLSRRHGLPLWMSRGTWRAIGAGEPDAPLVRFARDGEPDAPLVRFARDGEPIAIGSLQLTPYTVPHDAAEPLQLR